MLLRSRWGFYTAVSNSVKSLTLHLAVFQIKTSLLLFIIAILVVVLVVMIVDLKMT